VSGFVCILHSDGAPIERALLQSLTDFLSYRAPDGHAIWMAGSIGMGHALLRTTRQAKGEQQPASLEGRYWIVADARLDGREELIDELQQHTKGKPISSAPDCELILQAYAVWGTACVDRLRGDFSFAIWDAGHKQLFCARDHFGIKPFYCSQLGELFLFSNTLNCIRLHPRVSGELNEAAIGDFLLFGLNCDNATTFFRDIQRLPPAHSLTLSPRGVQLRRYWRPPTDGRIRYSKATEYIENFQSILEKAVGDRLRTDRVGILLSGGLDSSSVAAIAKDVSGRSAQAAEIRGYTNVYKSLIPDCDGDFAREVGEFLGFPVKFINLDEAQLFERWDDPDMSSPEPVDNPFQAAILDTYRDISADCRVLFSGEGSDNLMDFQMWPYVRDLRHRREWRRLLTEVGNYLWIRPFPWRGIRARTLRLVGKDPDQPVYPEWLTPEFARRARLVERWKERTKLPKSWAAHPIHPRGYASLALPEWTHMFEQENPGATGYPVETCYPFLDLRMVNYLLAIPPFPWFFKKMLVRESMAERLPERVRTRPKTPLRSDPALAQVQRSGGAPWKKIPLTAGLDRYVDRSTLKEPHADMNLERLSSCLRPYCLNIWLQVAQRIRYNIHAEATNG
jgi:asparagine synthase (glutamine-hydrolysing)